MRAPRVLLLGLAAAAASCSWVKMEPGAQSVRVARAGEDLSACQRAGEIAVSVRDRVGFYQRDDLTVRDELETLARNEADALRADTLQSLGPPLDGEQRFAGYRCGGAAVPPATAAPATPARAASEPVPAVEERSDDPATQPLRDAPRPTQGFEPIDEDG